METHPNNLIDSQALFNLSYGLFVLTAKTKEKDNACIVNTAIQVTEDPLRLIVALNKANYTHDMIVDNQAFAVSVLTQSTPYSIFERFGFHSGRDTDKFADFQAVERSDGDLPYLTQHVNTVIAANVEQIIDFETHSLFIAKVSQCFVLSKEPSVTYQYYFDNIKPKPVVKKKGFVCKICGYVYEGEELPAGFTCPVCKHGAEFFEPLK